MWTVFVRCVWELRPWMTSELTRDFSYLYFPQSLPFVLLSLDINQLPEYIFAHVVHGYLFMVQFLCFLRLNSQFDVVVVLSHLVGVCKLSYFWLEYHFFCYHKADRDVSQCLIKKKNRFCCYQHSKKPSNKKYPGEKLWQMQWSLGIKKHLVRVQKNIMFSVQILVSCWRENKVKLTLKPAFKHVMGMWYHTPPRSANVRLFSPTVILPLTLYAAELHL